MPIIHLLLVLEVWDGKQSYRISWVIILLVSSDLTFVPLLQGQMRTAKLKVLITHLLLVLVVWDGKPTYRKSWAVSLLVCSDLTLAPSFKMRIAKLKSAYNSLIIGPRGLQW